MNPLPVALLVMLLATPAKLSKLELGQKHFVQGDLEQALKALDGAALEGGDDATLERVHLLRAQCFAARQDFARAEEAFALALEANPEAALDPGSVDPTVVKVLDATRARLRGTLAVHTTPPGAALRMDGKDLGEAPQTLAVPIGRHRVEAKWPDGSELSTEVLVRPRRELRLQWVQGGGPVGRPLEPFADLRGTVEISAAGNPVSGGLDLGGGLEVRWFRLGLWARLYPYFGLVPRAAFFVPIIEALQLYVQVELPVWFRGGLVSLGVGGAGGGEFLVRRWLGAFVEAGGQQLFINNRGDATHFTMTAGARLRLP